MTRTRTVPRWRGSLVALLLLVSFALNVTALFIPFLDVRRGLSTDEYSLPRSIVLLWDKRLYVLAAVIVVFSVCFPFAKLAVLWGILRGRFTETRRRRWLDFVERYGKWSMVDVFIVCLMIALADDQLLLDASPRIGILCFTLAIMISMTCSAWMHAMLEPPPKLPSMSRASLVRLIVWQIVIFGLLVAVLLTPFLWIDDWLLVDRPISIVGAIVGLWNTGAHTLAGIIAFFLAFAPSAAVCLSVIVLARRRKRKPIESLHAFAGFVRHWDMLDVFALALGIFLAEGRAFVRTELASGAFLLALLLAVYWPASAFYRRGFGR